MPSSEDGSRDSARVVAAVPSKIAGSSTLEFAHLNACRACKVRVAAGAVKQPRFSSNLSTFMSNCILVATTSERNVSGRCRTTILPQARAFAPCGYLPAWGFFIAVHA
jgi:hypothetical protein